MAGDDDQDGYGGVFGLWPMSGVGFVTLSVFSVCEVDYCLAFAFGLSRRFYSL